MTSARILIVDDELSDQSTQQNLENIGYTVLKTMRTVDVAADKINAMQPDLIISKAIHFSLENSVDIPMLLLISTPDEDTQTSLPNTTPFNYLFKPWTEQELRMAIETALYKHQIEQQMLMQERWMTTVLNSIEDAVIATDEQGSVAFMNPTAEMLTGWEEEDAVGKPLSDVFKPVDKDHLPVTNLLTTAKTNRKKVTFEEYTLLLRQDGESYPIEESASPIIGNQDDILGAVLMFHDVTDRYKAEQALRESEEKYRLLFENSPESITLLGLDGTVIDCNKATTRLRQRPKEQIIGQLFTNVETLMEEDLAHYGQLFSQLLNGEEVQPLVIQLKDNGDTSAVRWVEAFPSLLHRDGRIDAIQVIARDITQRKLAEKELRHYQEHLEEIVVERTGELEHSNLQLARSNAELEQFAYVASHDLREPLRKIKSYTELLAQRYDGQLDERADKYIHYIVDGAFRMQELIAELLVYSRLGRAELKEEQTAISAILDDVVSDLEVSVQESSAEITINPLPTLTVDRQQINRLLQNLIGNALKFRSEQSPQINISAELEENEWVFAISDNGIGIEPQYVERIFLIFQRLHTRKEYAGTGIGLAICKKIVENHNGRIWVKSQPEQGTTFFFSLPTAKANN